MINAHAENVRLVSKGPTAGERDWFGCGCRRRWLPIQHLRLGRARSIAALCYARYLRSHRHELEAAALKPLQPSAVQVGQQLVHSGGPAAGVLLRLRNFAEPTGLTRNMLQLQFQLYSSHMLSNALHHGPCSTSALEDGKCCVTQCWEFCTTVLCQRSTDCIGLYFECLGI